MLELSITEDLQSVVALLPFQNIDYCEPVFVSECYRCFGGITFWKKKQNAYGFISNYALIAWHITPGNEAFLQTAANRLHARIEKTLTHFDPCAAFRCGGKLDIPENRFYYKRMKKVIEDPLKKLLSGIPIQGIEPTIETNYSTLFLSEDLQVFIEMQYNSKVNNLQLSNLFTI